MTTPEAQDGAQKQSENWTTGEEMITDAQQSYLQTLAQDAGVEVNTEGMTKAEASDKIDELQSQSGRVETGEAGN